MFPIPVIPWFAIYFVSGYLLWYLISRIALAAAWMYSKPGTFTARHWVFAFISFSPILMELVSTLIVVMGIAMGFDIHNKKDPWKP